MKLLLFIAAMIVSGALPVTPQPGVTGKDKVSTVDAAQFQAGSKLGSALAEDCSIFSGTVTKVGPLTKDASSDGPNAVLHARIAVKVDEWLWNKPPNAESVLQLDQTITPEARRLSSEGRSVWDGVDVQTGTRLIVALRNGKHSPNRFVVSDIDLFPSIGVTLGWHRQYMTNSSSLVSAPELAKDTTNPFFLGYFVTYLWRGGSFGNRDAEAITLGKLLTRTGRNASASALIRITLQRFVLSDSNRLSQAAQRSVTESLVIAGSSDDQKLAEEAITVLIRLADKRKLEMEPYLTAERGRRLRMNYQALVQTGRLGKEHAAFGTQLGRSPH